MSIESDIRCQKDENAITIPSIVHEKARGESIPLDEVSDEFTELKDLKQGLHQRHIQMIALAGTIGTGLFLGSGAALATAGPAAILMGYALVGIIVYGVVLSTAELSALVPLSGGIIRQAEYFVDPALSFALGWNTVLSCAVYIPAELIAAAILMQFWITINSAVWITVFALVLFASNIILVRIYGELEFSFATLKIMLIIGMNIMALVITCGGGPNHQAIGFKYWHNPGPFTESYLNHQGALGRFMAFWTTLVNAAYAYSGVESVSNVAAETRFPRRNIPKAAKRLFWRVLLFYVVSIFMLTLLVPSDDPALLKSSRTATKAPFVIAATRANIAVVPSIINFVILTSAWSSGNSSMLSSSRILFGLAHHNHAPGIFKKTSRFGIPYIAVAAQGIWFILGYMTLSSTASTVFTWFQSLIAASSMVGWIAMCLIYLRFYYAIKKQGISRDELPWKGPFQPYIAWFSFVSLIIILLTGGYAVFIKGHWNTATFISSYLDIFIALALYLCYKFVRRTKIIRLSEVPVRRFIDIANRNPEPPESPRTGWRRFNILWE